MLPVAVLAAAASLLITPPTKALLSGIDWRTLGTLFMMLTVLEGFKQENVFRPLLRLTGRIGTMAGLSLIGSLASVINYRIYVREYSGRGGKFIRTFTLISLAFFALVVLSGYFLSRRGI